VHIDDVIIVVKSDFAPPKFFAGCGPEAQYSSTGVPRNPTVPQSMWWGYVSFKGCVRVPRFFSGEMIACITMFMSHYENFLITVPYSHSK